MLRATGDPGCIASKAGLQGTRPEALKATGEPGCMWYKMQNGNGAATGFKPASAAQLRDPSVAKQSLPNRGKRPMRHKPAERKLPVVAVVAESPSQIGMLSGRRIAVLRAPGQLHMFPAWFPRVAAASPRLPGLYSVLARLAPGQTGRQHLAPSAAALSMQLEQ